MKNKQTGAADLTHQRAHRSKQKQQQQKHNKNPDKTVYKIHHRLQKVMRRSEKSSSSGKKEKEGPKSPQGRRGCRQARTHTHTHTHAHTHTYTHREKMQHQKYSCGLVCTCWVYLYLLGLFVPAGSIFAVGAGTCAACTPQCAGRRRRVSAEATPPTAGEDGVQIPQSVGEMLGATQTEFVHANKSSSFACKC